MANRTRVRVSMECGLTRKSIKAIFFFLTNVIDEKKKRPANEVARLRRS